MATVEIDFGRLASYECGAVLVTLLAYPEPDTKDEIRGALHRSLCHLYLQARSEVDPEWAGKPQLIKPTYAFVGAKQVSRDIRQLKRRLRDRMVAARMAIPFLQEIELGKVPKLPKTVARLSLNQMSALVLDDLEGADELNVETRVWRPSLPVIHLATATAVVIDQIEKLHQQKVSIGHLLTDPALVRLIIVIAANHSQLLYKIKRFSITPDTLIQVCAIESA